MNANEFGQKKNWFAHLVANIRRVSGHIWISWFSSFFEDGQISHHEAHLRRPAPRLIGCYRGAKALPAHMAGRKGKIAAERTRW